MSKAFSDAIRRAEEVCNITSDLDKLEKDFKDYVIEYISDGYSSFEEAIKMFVESEFEDRGYDFQDAVRDELAELLSSPETTISIEFKDTTKRIR